jgi:hypothetical protein
VIEVSLTPRTLLVCGVVAYVPLQILTWVYLLHVCWRERWNGKFRNSPDLATEDLPPEKYADSDPQAFVDTLTDSTVPTIKWHMTIVTTSLVAAAVALSWLVLTLVVAGVEVFL